MVLVGGSDRRIVSEIAEGLLDGGLDVARFAPEDVDSGDLFMRLAVRPADLVHVEAIPRLGRAANGGSSLERLVRQVAAAGPCRLILVTARAADDPDLLGLRRSGVSYLVLRAARLIDVDDRTAADLAAGKRIVVPADLAERAAGALLVSDVCAAVAAAVVSEESGRSIEIAPADGAEALYAELARRGARPTRSRLGAALARLAGAPRLALGATGLLEVGRPGDRYAEMRSGPAAV